MSELPQRRRGGRAGRPVAQRSGRVTACDRAATRDCRAERRHPLRSSAGARRDTRRRDDYRTAVESRHVHHSVARHRRPPASAREVCHPRVRDSQGISNAVLQGQAERAGDRRSGDLPDNAEGPTMKMRMREFTVVVGVLAAAAIVSGQAREWTTYSGDMLGQRHSPLTQITAENVKNLELQWVFQARSLEKFEATPLVVDGVMYTVQPSNDVVAMDAATGRVFWVYPYIPSPLARLCCGRVNRGLAIHENTLYMATIDGRLIAIDAKTGGLVWNVAVGGARPDTGYSLTVAPLIVKDKVILGTAGGEYGVRGFIAAFDAKSGREVWRFHTIAGPGEKGNETWAGDSWKTGGGSIWVTGTYDADLNVTYWGVGNPGPDWNGDVRLGDNLYSDSVVALDADTGALKWHFQFTPHDVYDYDSVQVPVLAAIQWQGKARQAM